MSQHAGSLAQPIAGWWTLQEFPERVAAGGRTFRLARWKQGYPGVVEQYREEVERYSMHMKVYANGYWVIDHIDEDNPDLGRELPHFFNDHPVGKAAKWVGTGAAVVGGMIVLAHLAESLVSAAFSRA